MFVILLISKPVVHLFRRALSTLLYASDESNWLGSESEDAARRVQTTQNCQRLDETSMQLTDHSNCVAAMVSFQFKDLTCSSVILPRTQPHMKTSAWKTSRLIAKPCNMNGDLASMALVQMRRLACQKSHCHVQTQ